MFCVECGFKNEDGMQFCTRCGKPLNVDVSQAINDSNNGVNASPTPGTVSAVEQTTPLDAVTERPTQVTNVMSPIPAAAGPSTAGFQPAMQGANVSTMNPVNASGTASKGKSSNKVILIVVVAVAVLAIVGAGCFLYFSGKLDGILPGSERNIPSAVENQQARSGEQSAQVVGSLEKSEHTVVFETNGGTVYEQLKVMDDDVITTPAEPVRYGYIFNGWFLNSACTDKINFPYTVKQDDPEKLIIYAGWKDSNDYSSNSSYDDGIFPQSSTEYLNEDDVDHLNKDQIQRAINEIYARNGYIFQKSMKEKRYFESQPWYVGTEKNMEKVRSKFNRYELANEKLLTRYREYLN